MKQVILALDIGGSFIKSGLLTVDGLMASMPTVPIDSSKSHAEIRNSIAAVVEMGRKTLGDSELTSNIPDGIAVAIPGRFDYHNGVSLMRHKFAGIYGMNLTSLLRESIPAIKTVPARFCHDTNAFLAGERWRGCAMNHDTVLGITLGTGIGVSLFAEGKLWVDELGGPAAEVSVWSKPYRSATVEHYVSTRTLVAKFADACPELSANDGICDIAMAAENNNPAAIKIFNELGSDLGAVLSPLCERFKPQAMIFGGQVSKSFSLFKSALQDTLTTAVARPELLVGKLGDSASLFGATAMFFDHFRFDRNIHWSHDAGLHHHNVHATTSHVQDDRQIAL